MKSSATLLLLALAPAVCAQSPVKILTTPKPPSAEVLSRLSLTEAWRTRIKTDSRRDGLFSVQVIPGRTPKDTPQVVVQTYAGGVILLDGETGDLLWRTEVGLPYWPGQPVAYNANSIIVTRREYIYILNRANGTHRVLVEDKVTKEKKYGFPMLNAPTAPPVAD